VPLDGGSVFFMVARGNNNDLDEYHTERFVDLAAPIDVRAHQLTPPPPGATDAPTPPPTTTTTTTTQRPTRAPLPTPLALAPSLLTSFDAPTISSIVLVALFVVTVAATLAIAVYLLIVQRPQDDDDGRQ
jgi:hypothetical protein